MSKLLSARFLVTLALTATFCYITILGKVGVEVYIPVLIMVYQFYFKEKKRGDDEHTKLG